MKIKSLRISNVLSFKYYENIDEASEVKFDEGLNILIGQNGSGKSTALEVINFIFKRVLFRYYTLNQDIYVRRSSALADERRTILTTNLINNYGGFRLEPNWDYEDSPQKIKLELILDEIDKKNFKLLEANQPKLAKIAGLYSGTPDLDFKLTQDSYTLNITLEKNNKTFSANVTPETDPGFIYLQNYNFYKELINIYNLENPKDLIEPLYESFTLIGGYRNYNAFIPSVSIQGELASKQIQTIRSAEYSRSMNAMEQSEPSVFGLVRLRVAGNHFDIYGEQVIAGDAERIANEQTFLKKINQKLKLVNLKTEIKLTDKRTWAYSFSFHGIKRDRPINDINALSAGEKSIIHLVFEAYGRGDLKGGVVIIDEPEIHLHYQFQNEYLRIIEEINKEQSCQYILVTHSESLINSETISKVKRFALDSNFYTWIASPGIQENQKTLIKILDNTRSTYAFFSKKVVLVEGDSDRYFFKAVLLEIKPELNQEIAFLDIGGKGNYEKWKRFFEGFGLEVHYIGDFDNVFTLEFSGKALIKSSDKEKVENELKQGKLDSLTDEQKRRFKEFYEKILVDHEFLEKPKRDAWKPLVDKFNELSRVSNNELVHKIKELNTNIDNEIEQKYSEKIYILKQGSLESYIGTSHSDLTTIISFCENDLSKWLLQNSEIVQEVKFIIDKIIST